MVEILKFCVSDRSELHCVPVYECQTCGYFSPFHMAGPFILADGTVKIIWFCPWCSDVPSSTNGLKGYITIEELEKITYEQEQELVEKELGYR